MSQVRGGRPQCTVQPPPQQHVGQGILDMGAVMYNRNTQSQMVTPAGAPALSAGGPAGMQSMMSGQKSDNQSSLPNGTMTTSTEQASNPTGRLANTKEKTPMCLINELARYNKIQHQYHLVDEDGPAHRKVFYVKLKLGEEEYSASGPSIKKAQHAAAGVALSGTHFKHPPPRPKRLPNDVEMYGSMQSQYTDDGAENNITPTVELNALAMKRGERPVYSPIEPQRQPFNPGGYEPRYDYRGMYNQRYYYPRMPRIFYVSLKIGQREFIGEGPSRQAARHGAAAKALKVLRNLPVPNPDKTAEAPTESEETDPDDLKSEISLVHEIALKRKMTVDFKVTSESGPPHMRNFITRCTVGDSLVTEAEGNGKKISKKRAAKAMLEELRKLPQLPSMAPVKPKQKNPINKKKNRNLIKMQKACPDYGVGINPISRLIQIQQAKKEKEPLYTLEEERGKPRKREFVMQVQVGPHVAKGVGTNKKLARRNAAEAMLQTLGYSKPSPQPDKSALKTQVNGISNTGNDPNKKVTFSDQENSSSGRQLVPGVILMPGCETGSGLNRAPGGSVQMGDSVSQRTTAVIAKELLDKGASPTAESMRKTGARLTSQNVVQPKMQLLYLADVLGFQVQFTDFPKGNNKNEYLSLVSLSTNPPQVSHGAGATIEASHDAAALTALRSLVEMGIDNVTEVKPPKKELAAGDAFWWDETADVQAGDQMISQEDVTSQSTPEAD